MEMKSRPKFVDIRKSSRRDKKLMVVFDDGLVVHFGARGYGDFVAYSAKNRDLAEMKRNAYIARHGATENWTNPYTAATLSRYILWEKPTLRESIRFYRRKFRI